MARDYARRRSSAPPPAQVPGWVFMLVGLLIGVVVTGLFFAKGSKESKEVTAFVQQNLPKNEQKPAPAPAAAVAPPAPTPAPAPAAKPEPKPEPKPAEKKDEKIDYSFYKELEKQEVSVTEQSVTQKPGEKPKTDPQKPADAAAQQPFQGKKFIQVGAFPTAKEAEEHKAMLAMTIGETASIQQVNVDGKPAWHRVRLGPYTDQKSLDRIRQKLQGNGVKYMVFNEKP